MAGKKDNLALFELVHQGEKKSSSWFSRRKKTRFGLFRGATKVAQADKVDLRPGCEPSIHGPKAGRAELRSSGSIKTSSLADEKVVPSLSTVPAAVPPDFAEATGGDGHDGAGIAGFVEKRVSLTLPYWTIGLSILALILVLLIAYQMGRGKKTVPVADNVPGRTPVSTAKSGDGFDRSTLPDRGVDSLADPANQGGLDWEFSNSPSATSTGRANPSSISANPPSSEKKLKHLLICSHKDDRTLEFVAKFFNDNKIYVKKARQGSRYVLITEATFEVGDKVAENKLKKIVAKIGSEYYTMSHENSAKYPIFSKKTFEEAYAVTAK